MCSDLLVCKAVCQKIFTKVLLGLMVGGQRASTVQGCEGALLSGWLGALRAEFLSSLPCAGMSEPNTSGCYCSCERTQPLSPDCLRGGIRKPLPHFGAGYTTQCWVFSFKGGDSPSCPSYDLAG